VDDDTTLGVLEDGFGDRRMAQLVSWRTRVGHMLTVETALARALARVGILDEGDAGAVAEHCTLERVDLDELAERTPDAGTPVVALLELLREGGEGRVADVLHHGATSQDIIDTAMVLAVRDALEMMADQLKQVGDRLAALADQHRSTQAAGRTLGQHAVLITHGLRFARWLGAIDRHRTRLDTVRDDVLVLQLGGAVGTLSAWGDDGLQVAAAMADELDLVVPDLPWHAERDRVAVLAGQLAALVGTVDTIGAELVRLAQTEIAELHPTSGGGSSAMPHKSNPTHATAARAAARLARAELVELAGGSPVEHERAAGGWQAEWVLLPSALVRSSGALERLQRALTDLEVDADRSRDNIAAAHWAVLAEALQTALLLRVGRTAAADITRDVAAQARHTRRPLPEVAADHDRVSAALDDEELQRALDPAAGLTMVHELIDRALATHRSTTGGLP
jgi:3-carboxy-cis,cis-muconate cycloisomerase